MATVRLHTQHHSSGGLRPATPTCCSCSCCCVGSAVGALAILPVMIARAAADQRPEHAVVPPESPSGSFGQQRGLVPPTLDKGFGPWGEGIAAFALAALPVLITWLLWPEPEVIIIAFVTTVLALTIWAVTRARDAGRSAWPPLVVTFVILPLAVAVEFYIGINTASGDSSGYWVAATTIGAIVFGIGVLFTVVARRS